MIQPQLEIEYPDVEWIEPNPFQPRRIMPEESLAELSQSILDHGVLQPILLRPVNKNSKGIKFQIIAGERRWRANILAGHTTIPAVVRDVSDIESGVLALIENTQREDVDDYGTAMAMQKLMERSAKAGHPLSDRALAKRLNKSQSYVRNFLGLFNLRAPILEMVQRHVAVRSSAYEIQKVKDPSLERELIEAVDKGASFKAVKAQVDSHLADTALVRESARPPDAHTRKTISKAQERAQQAQREALDSLAIIERHARNLGAWWPELDAGTRQDGVGRCQKVINQLSKLK